MGLVDAIRAAESALGQARSLLDAVDSAGADINRAVAALPSAIADIQNGINQADGQLQQGTSTRQSELERGARRGGGRRRRCRRRTAAPTRSAPSPA